MGKNLLCTWRSMGMLVDKLRDAFVELDQAEGLHARPASCKSGRDGVLNSLG